MLFNLKTIVIASLAVLATASPAPQAGSGQCNTGNLMCCQSTQNTAPEPKSGLGGLLGLLGIVLQSVDIPLGVTCTPISVIGLGNSGCTAQPVCCENNNFNGVVALGCSPISAGL